MKTVDRELDFTSRRYKIGSSDVPFTFRIEQRRSERALKRTYNSAEIDQGKFRAKHCERS